LGNACQREIRIVISGLTTIYTHATI
jgi:hypothetical protein